MPLLKKWSLLFFYIILFFGLTFINELQAQIDLELPHSQGDVGDEKQIAITVSDMTEAEIVAYQFEIHFDEGIVSITETDHSGTITPNSPTVNIQDSYISVAWAGTSPLEGEGDLLYLTLDMVGEGISDLEWQSVMFYDLNNEDVGVTEVNGSITVGQIDSETFSVTFDVIDENNDPIDDAVVTFAGEGNAPGDYVFEDIEPGEYTYTVERASYQTASGEIEIIDQDITETVTLIEVIAPPDAPVLVSPEDNETGVPTTVTLTWDDGVPSGETYHLQVATDSDFSELIIDADSLTVQSYEVVELAHQTTYYWRVNATNEGGTSEWSEEWSFTTIVALPGQVPLDSPADEEMIGTDTVVFVWFSGEADITHYELEVATDAAFNNIFYATDNTTDTSYVFTDVLDETEYWWRVRGHNEAGAGEYSDVWMFEIILTGVDDVYTGVVEQYKLYQNYPNPFNPSTTIRFSIPERSQVRVEIYNTLGQRITSLVDEELHAGFHEVVWNADMARVSSGTYMYRIEAVSVVDPGNEFTEIRSMILVK